MKAKEFIPASKPRNFVAKNAQSSGAGRHQDSSKKKDQDQGKVKHKKDLVPMESAPKGWEGTVKAMKKHKDIDNPYALAWSMKNKGYKSHKKEGVAEGWKDEADDFSEWSDYVREKLSKASPEQRPGLAKRLSQVEVKNFGSSLSGGFDRNTGKAKTGELTDTVRSIMRSFGKEADDTRRAQAAIDGRDGPAGNFSMPFGSVDVAGLEDAPPEVLRVMKKAVMLGGDVAAAARNFYKKHGTLTDQDLPKIQQSLASAASDEWKKKGRTTEGSKPEYIDKMMDKYKASLTNPNTSKKPSSGAAKTDDKLRAYYAARKIEKQRTEEGISSEVDVKGRTQQQWIKLVKAKFPTAKIAQAKMMGGPIIAYLDDGRKISWKKAEQGVTEGSAHGYNVAKWYEKNGDQLKLTKWLRKEAGLPKDADVYFDDADLVYGDQTIVPGALVDPKLKFNDLLTALVQATGGTAKQKVDGVYRDQGMEEGAPGNDFRVGQRVIYKTSQGQEFPSIVTAVDFDEDAVKIKSANNKPFPNSGGDIEIVVDPGWKFLTVEPRVDPDSIIAVSPSMRKTTERVRDPEDWDEGNTEPPNNFAVYINGKKWKVFKGRGQYADDAREQAHYQQLKDWARKKSEETGKKWEVSITGEGPTA